MTWAAKKEAIRSIVSVLAGVHTKAVSWKGKPDASASKIVKLDVIQAKQETPDRRIKTMNEATGNFDPEVSTLIVFTVSVHCEDIKGDCLDLAESIRSGFAWESTEETLETSGLAVVDFPGSIVPVPASIDERAQDAVVFDVIFRAEFHRADPVAQSTIEHVDGSGDLTNPTLSVSFSADRPPPEDP